MRIVAAAIILIAGSNGEAQACACCTNVGQRIVQGEALGSHARGVLEDIRFADTAEVYVGEGDLGPMRVLGLTSQRPSLTVRRNDLAMVFALQPGFTLTLRLRPRFARFEVDRRLPVSGAEALGPTLYKEWRFSGEVSTSGVSANVKPRLQRATLVLHGESKGCTDAAHFHAWTLVIEGRGEPITLFGNLVR
jgi:hypothetical protein